MLGFICHALGEAGQEYGAQRHTQQPSGEFHQPVGVI